MPRPRITGRPQNVGQTRTAQVRNNAEVGRGVPFQGNLAPNAPTTPQQECPPGQERGVDPNTGASICRPARPNIAGNVPVNGAPEAVASGPQTGRPTKSGY